MLELDGLRKRFGAVDALTGLDLQAHPGRILGLVGPNGAGKTTAMRAVFGLVGLDEGSVRWCGSPIGGRERLRFGYMPEQRGLYPRMRVGRQLCYLARLRGLSAAAAQANARRWLAALGVEGRAGDRLSQLSHGNQQRVQLGAALIHDPELLLLDEPFSGLDPFGADTMARLLRERALEGTTVVVSSHQLDLVQELCDDVVIVAAGRDRLAGTIDAVRGHTGSREVTVRLADGRRPVLPGVAEMTPARDGAYTFAFPVEEPADRLLADLAHQGVVERFAIGPPTLSAVFRAAVEVGSEHETTT